MTQDTEDAPNGVQIEFDNNDAIDMVVYKDHSGIRIFLGRGSSVIMFPLENLDEFIEFLKKAKELPVTDW